MAYVSLFVTAFVAATLLPAFSEVALGGLATQGHAAGWLWISATAGNTLGSVAGGIIGRQIHRFESERWFPFSEQQLATARERFDRYGKWSLLFAWLPIVGDPLTLIGGVMRVPWLHFVVLVAVGKGVRYAVVLWIALRATVILA